MDQLNTLNLSPEQLLLAAVATVLLISALIALWVSRRRQKKVAGRRLDVPGVLAHYRDSHPAFFRIMHAFQENPRFQELLQRREISEAFRVLSRSDREDAGKKAKKNRNSVLELSGPSQALQDRRLQAAMLTILRNIYMDKDLRQSVSPAVDRDLDKLLDQLQ